MRIKTRKVLPKEEYAFGTPTRLGSNSLKRKTVKSDHPYGLRKGYHLARVNSNTWIEVKDGHSDEKAVKRFIEKMQQSQRAFYSNLLER